MKLASALSERTDIQNRISELAIRLNNNAKVQDGDKPAEDPIVLMEELDRLLKRLEELMARINLTNSRTVSDGNTITEILVKRDCLKKKIELTRNFLDSASNKVSRMTRTEIKIISTVPVSEMQTKLDELSKQLRITGEKIQELNWTTELI